MMRATTQKSVLVTDGEQRAALAIVRSLGAAGYRCIVSSKSGRSLAGRSRHAASELEVPDATGEPDAFTAAIVNASRLVDVIIPVSEASLLALLPERDRISAELPFAPAETFRAVCDKATVLEVAGQLGIRVPRQRIVSNAAELAEIAQDLPLVLKPHSSVVSDGNGGRISVGVRWAHTPSDLHRVISEYPDSVYPLLAQEVISGPGIGIFVLMENGNSIASFSHRRVREKPPSGGVSVVCQSEPLDEALLAKSVQLLQHFRWTGPAMVEYKRDYRTGDAVLMEINGRFWGSLQLAIDSGVDFPRLMLERAFEDAVEIRDLAYRSVRTRWFWGDVDHLIARWKDPNEVPLAKVGAFFQWLAAFRPSYKSQVFRWHDPRPFFHETAVWFKDLKR